MIHHIDTPQNCLACRGRALSRFVAALLQGLSCLAFPQASIGQTAFGQYFATKCAALQEQ